MRLACCSAVYEYRHVVLPPEIAQLLPKGRLLSEVCVGSWTQLTRTVVQRVLSLHTLCATLEVH